MQSDYKEIYKLTSERTGKPEQLYKDLGNFVFASLYKEIRKPKQLIIKLKGVGSWILRRKRMQIIVNEFPPNFEKEKEEFTSEYGFLKNENKKEIYNLFKERLGDYDRYIELRDQIRKIRYADQKIIQPPTWED